MTMTDTPMTDEEAAALRQQLAAHDAVQNEARKAANRAKLQPLVDLGLGGLDPVDLFRDRTGGMPARQRHGSG